MQGRRAVVLNELPPEVLNKLLQEYMLFQIALQEKMESAKIKIESEVKGMESAIRAEIESALKDRFNVTPEKINEKTKEKMKEIIEQRQKDHYQIIIKDLSSHREKYLISSTPQAFYAPKKEFKGDQAAEKTPVLKVN